MINLPNKLILIDGSCNFCHSSVKWVEKYSKEKDFYYSNIQSDLGKNVYLEYHIDPAIDSVLFIEKGELRTHSTAILKICRYLKFPFSLLSIFLIVPKWIRDPVYKLIARNRYQLFGKKQSCELPSIDFNNRVLS